MVVKIAKQFLLLFSLESQDNSEIFLACTVKVNFGNVLLKHDYKRFYT